VKKKPPFTVDSGMFVARDKDGRIRQVAAGEPQATVCRRVADFPRGLAPDGATILACTDCGAAIATAHLFPDKPSICFQCAHIEPLPWFYPEHES
jgi:hypothetical protein